MKKITLVLTYTDPKNNRDASKAALVSTPVRSLEHAFALMNSLDKEFKTNHLFFIRTKVAND